MLVTPISDDEEEQQALNSLLPKAAFILAALIVAGGSYFAAWTNGVGNPAPPSNESTDLRQHTTPHSPTVEDMLRRLNARLTQDTITDNKRVEWDKVLEAAGRHIVIIMQCVLTFGLGGLSGFVIIAKRFGPKDKHWAYATLGTIFGFWIKQ